MRKFQENRDPRSGNSAFFFTRAELFILIAGILMRSCLFFSVIRTGNYFLPDSYGYLTLSENFFNRGIFSQQLESPFVPDVQRTPLYPVFLSFLMNSPAAVVPAQMIITILNAFLVYLIGFRLYGRKEGRIAGWFYFIQPVPAVFSCLILSETVFILLFLSFIKFFADFLIMGKSRLRSCFLSSSFLSLSILVRPHPFYLIVPVLLYIFFDFSHNLRKRFSFMAVFLIPLILLPGLWMYRNHLLIQRFTLSTVEYTNVLWGRLGGLLCYQKGLDFLNEKNLRWETSTHLSRHIGEENIYNHYSSLRVQETEVVSKQALLYSGEYIIDHFADYVAYTGICLTNLATGIGRRTAEYITGSFSFSWAAGIFQMLCNCIMYFSLFLIIFRVKWWNKTIIFFFIAIIYFTLLSAVAFADTRYRMHIDPLLCIITGLTLSRLCARYVSLRGERMSA